MLSARLKCYTKISNYLFIDIMSLFNLLPVIVSDLTLNHTMIFIIKTEVM